MKWNLRQKAALAIAGIADFIDIAVLGALPGVGEPLDIGVALLNAYLLKDPKPLAGLIEVSSIIPPAAALDFVPVHSLVTYYTIREQNKK